MRVPIIDFTTFDYLFYINNKCNSRERYIGFAATFVVVC